MVSIIYDPSLSAPWDLQCQHLPKDFVNALAPASGGASADAPIVALLPDNAEFIAVAGSESASWVPGYADGYSGWVSSSFLKKPDPIPALSISEWDPSIWQGVALSETNVRSKPDTT